MRKPEAARLHAAQVMCTTGSSPAFNMSLWPLCLCSCILLTAQQGGRTPNTLPSFDQVRAGC